MIGDRPPNPFDGAKVLYHMKDWAAMERGVIPPPVLVTIDPITSCNLKCRWCNAAHQTANGDKLSRQQIAELPGVLYEWGVQAVCIAGGGEPLLHPQCSNLIKGLIDNGIEVGVVTNGTRIDHHLEALSLCRWVGVSVDAGSKQTYAKIKGRDVLALILENIAALRRFAPDLEITWKYLITPDNAGEIETAARAAREMKCTNFHARPAGRAWFEDKTPMFSASQIDLAVAQCKAAKAIHSDRFGVHVTTDKFSDAWDIKHRFSQCRATGMTAVIQPGEVGLCCDRRGDDRTKLGQWDNASEIPHMWGSLAHRRVIDEINIAGLKHCPRCTYSPHNQLYEAFVTSDLTCKNFI